MKYDHFLRLPLITCFPLLALAQVRYSLSIHGINSHNMLFHLAVHTLIKLSIVGK